jgi:hypothetical protein
LALGKRAFDEAYSYLKQHAANDEVTIFIDSNDLYRGMIFMTMEHQAQQKKDV